MNALGLMAYELVGPFDLWVTAKKLLAAQKLGEDRLRTIDATGTYVIPRATGRAVWSYKPDWGDKANFFSRDRLLVAGLRYPVCRLEDVRSDGAYRLIPIAIPDKNDEYTARADERWVRLEEVDILQGREPFSVVKSADGKAWTVTFYTDVPVKVADLRPGQAYIISGAAKKELQWPDNQNAEKLLFVPQGVKLTAETATEIRLKHKPGGRVNILFL
jgi:hypothetical protein